MANEIRLRRNNISGTITDNPLAIGATTINSAGFVDLPTVDATNHLILILDPQEVGGTAEIVRVTAHTAAATSVTVVRGQEGTTARSHVFGTTWMHGPIADDFILNDVTSSTRPSTVFVGQGIFENDTKKLMFHNGTDWAPRDAGGQLGYAEVTGGDQGLSAGTEALLTGLSVTCTVGTNRRIRITQKTQFFAAAADTNNGVRIRIKQDTVDINGGAAEIGNCSNQYVQTCQHSVVLTPSAGSHTYTVSAQRVNGAQTVTSRSNNTTAAFILIEDIGAA